jgi:signal transduction histidine kinase
MLSPSRLVLATGFGVLLSLVAAIGAAGFAAASTTQAEIVAVHQNYTARSEQLRELAMFFFACGMDLRDALLLPGEETRSKFRDSQAAVEKRLAAIAEPGDLPAALDAYWRSADATLNNPTPNMIAGLRSRRQEVAVVARRLDELNRQSLAAEKGRIDELRAGNRRFFQLLLTIAIVLGGAIAFFAWHRVGGLERQTATHEAELLRLSRSLVRAQEEERRNIARELHDELGQQLTGMGMLLGSLQRLREEPTRFTPVLDDARRLNIQTLRSVRTLALGLRPSMLDDLGLQPALEWFAGEFSRRSGIPVHPAFQGCVERIPEPHRTSLYRAVQETLTNAARHSKASRIDLALSATPSEATLTITDNGVGFDPKSSSAMGQGLLGLGERIRELHGRFTMDSSPGRGAKLIARVPISEVAVSP